MRLGASDAFVVRWIFLRGLALVWAVAFASLGVQIRGLAGPEGVLPAGQFLAAVRDAYGGVAPGAAPTLCWWLGTGGGTLEAMCAAGVALAALLAAGILAGPVSLLLWALYLSVAVACTEFLSFQWDTLLLETGLLAMFIAPWKLRAFGLVRDRPPSRTVLLLLRLLLFKLMFLSGAVKLASRDPVWRDLTALDYHYWTTCLPTWTGWWAHRLPLAVDRASAAGMFALELLVPFLVFAPVRRLRVAAFALLAILQMGIAATGNYGFFNLLSLVLCVTALDDTALRRLIPRRGGSGPAPPTDAWVPPLRRVPAFVLAAAVLPLSLGHMQARLLGVEAVPEPLLAWMRAAAPWRSVNAYGLFADMTTARREIILEGSSDGQEWLPYEFRWKPGDPLHRPGFVQPHMPRLDWQMWFAALSERRPTWFLLLQERLLDGSPPVLALLGTNPFHDAPPRFLRAVIWDYRFADAAERQRTGAWWVRSRPVPYGPTLARERGEDESAELSGPAPQRSPDPRE
ncbi:MAG: lipase maturation factor family protein [Candidatus Eiseniibacteriota bacterium]